MSDLSVESKATFSQSPVLNEASLIHTVDEPMLARLVGDPRYLSFVRKAGLPE